VVLASTTEPSRTRESRMPDQPCLSRRKATQVTFGPSIDSRNATEGARQLTSTEDSCSSRSGVASSVTKSPSLRISSPAGQYHTHDDKNGGVRKCPSVPREGPHRALPSRQ